MDFNEIKRNRQYVSSKIVDMKMQLERANATNQQYEELDRKRLELVELNQSYEKYLSDLKRLKLMVTEEDSNFKQRRVNYLNEIITEKVSQFFPDEEFKAKITYDTRYNTVKAGLVLIDPYGNFRKPSIAEGQLCQYLISFAAIDGIISSINKHNIYIDEAFGVSSKENLVKVGEMLAKSAASGMQIILISQDAGIYEDIDHREITIYKDSATGSTVVDSIVDIKA